MGRFWSRVDKDCNKIFTLLTIGSMLIHYIHLAEGMNPLAIEAIYSEVKDGGMKNNNNASTTRIKRSLTGPDIVVEDTEIPPANYRRFELPPTDTNSATVVNISIVVMNILDIKELDEEISMEMNLRTYWTDKRLKQANASSSQKTPLIVQPELIEKLWHPDLFIDHVKSVNQPNIMSRPASLKIYPDTQLIRYSTRLTLRLSCSFNFKYYPADTQTCNVDIKSYAYPEAKMKLQWKESREGKGASFSHELTLGNYWARMANPNAFDLETFLGTYSGLSFSIILTRRLESHLLQTYGPSFLLVILSWITFCLNYEETVLKITIPVSSFIMLGLMFTSLRQTVPNVSYIKAIDIWMIGCIISVLLVILEIAFVFRIRSIKPKPKDPTYSSSLLDPGARDPFASDQNIAYNHFNAMRGARGSVATVYYPGSGNNPQVNHQQKRMSMPRPGLGLPGQLDEADEEEQYVGGGSTGSGGSGGYVRRPSAPYAEADSPGLYMRRPTLGGLPGLPGGNYAGRPLPNPNVGIGKQVQFHPTMRSSPSRSQSNSNLQSVQSQFNAETNTKYTKIASCLDLMFSILIPILFLCFNFLYWPWLIGSSRWFSFGQENTEEIIPSYPS